MMYEEWMDYLTGEMKVPYIAEISETAPDWAKKEYWKFRRELEEMREHPEKGFINY